MTETKVEIEPVTSTKQYPTFLADPSTSEKSGDLLSHTELDMNPSNKKS